MAQLVELIGVTHNPSLPRRFAKTQESAGLIKTRDKFEQMHQKLLEARPDILLVVASDHLNQWFMHNMPALLVGKAPFAQGPFPREEEEWSMPRYEARVDVEVAKCIIRGGFEHSVDFAFSDEFLMDHAFTVPLSYLHPEATLPIVPIFTNVMAPPVATARRFYQIGEALRRIIDELPGPLRVGVIGSGHLSVELGASKTLKQSACDPEFDAQAVELIGRGDVEGLLREMTWERMLRAGNVTSGFLNFMVLVGLARGQPASQSEGIFMDANTAPFFTWDLHKGTVA